LQRVTGDAVIAPSTQIKFAYQCEIEGTGVSRLHDEMESASQVSRVYKASSAVANGVLV